MQLLDITIASKETLKEKLFSILDIPGFNGKDPADLFGLLKNLTESLIDDISFVIESPTDFNLLIIQLFFIKSRYLLFVWSINLFSV